MRRKRNIRRRAFTLIEVMVAIAIFMMLIAVIYSTWALVMRATQVGQSAAARAQRQRVAMRTLEESLQNIQSFQASQRYYSFIVANGDVPVLSYASRVPYEFPRFKKYNDNLRRVTFSVETGADGQRDLVLRQNPVLMDMDESEQKNPLVLAHNVKDFIIECWDTNQMEWVTEWNNTNDIPPGVRVSMVVGAGVEINGGQSAEWSAVREFYLPSHMVPVALERGGAGGFGGPPGGGLQPPPINVPGRNPQ